jgi:8-oxo-dGTP diphosphatase/putative hydrolase of the HAD superfamily
MAIKAVLFDVGGPIDTETARERAFDQALVVALAAEGIRVTPDAYAGASAQAVSAFAPSAYKAIIWSLCGGDVERARAAYSRFIAATEYLPDIEPRPGIAELFASLRGRRLRLGLAANQPHDVLERLDAHGLGGFFEHREVSGTHGYRKPDVRLFLRCCDALGVAPDECIMVGDRIDNDIAPARSLGMHAILFRTGRHIAQQPRSWDELPCSEVTSVPELAAALDSMVGGAS